MHNANEPVDAVVGSSTPFGILFSIWVLVPFLFLQTPPYTSKSRSSISDRYNITWAGQAKKTLTQKH